MGGFVRKVIKTLIEKWNSITLRLPRLQKAQPRSGITIRHCEGSLDPVAISSFVSILSFRAWSGISSFVFKERIDPEINSGWQKRKTRAGRQKRKFNFTLRLPRLQEAQPRSGTTIRHCAILSLPLAGDVLVSFWSFPWLFYARSCFSIFFVPKKE